MGTVTIVAGGPGLPPNPEFEGYVIAADGGAAAGLACAPPQIPHSNGRSEAAVSGGRHNKAPW